MTLNELLENIQSDSAETRTTAWQQAGTIGAAAVKPLAGLCTQTHQEKAGPPGGAWRGSYAQSAPLGLGRGNRASSGSCSACLVTTGRWLCGGMSSGCSRRLAGDESVPPIAALLNQESLREDARMALERIPGDTSLAALRKALDAGPKDFRPNIAQSLRARGEAVDPKAYPCQKLVPTK